MISGLTNVHDKVWLRIESRFIPFQQGAYQSKLFHVLPLALELPFGILLSCVQVANKTLAYLGSFSPWPQLPDPHKDFNSVLKDAREWKKLGNIENQIKLGHGISDFIYGVATCTYQDSGFINCPQSQWALWEKKKIHKDNQSYQSANLFEKYKTKEGRNELIDQLHRLGVNSYRFSIEWSHVEPEEGKWNEVNLQVYINLCKALRDHGITPMITLHHFSEPIWFYEKGSFENEQNLNAFINFALYVVPRLTENYKGLPLVDHFCTINEPPIDAFSRYIRGEYAPGRYFNFKRAAHFLKGALKAHCLAYEKLKKIVPESVKIGIVHQYLKFIPTNPLLFPITYYLTRFINEASLNFFSTGKFEYKMPFLNVTDNKMPKPQTDFVGLQYYGRPVIGLLGPTSFYAPMTQMPMCEDPEGLYEAIIETHKAYQVPVIITENGISTHDDSQRERYISRALYAAQRAAEKIGKKNLIGYFLWCLTGLNLEWEMGMRPQAFGAFSPDGKIKRGSEIYPKAIKNWKKSVQQEQVSIL